MVTNGELSDVEICSHHPLYLHYFDRELGSSVGFSPDDRLIRETTTCLLIASPVRLYCGLSPTWETSYGDRSISDFVAQLASGGHLDLISNHPTKDEFVAARREAYQHDAARYPMYFEDDHGALESLVPTVGKAASATETLRNEMLIWTTTPPEALTSGASDAKRRDALLKAVRTAIEKRDHQAVTFALFQPRLGKLVEEPHVSGILKRQISASYTKHNRMAEGGEIPTGIRGLSEYDRISCMFPYYDVPLLRLIIDHIGANALAVSPERWEEFLAIRGGQEHFLFAERLRVFIAGIASESGLPIPALSSRRERIAQSVRRLLLANPFGRAPACKVIDILLAAISRLNTLLSFGRSLPNFALGTTTMEEAMHFSTPTPVLLMVATEVEHAAVLDAARANGMGSPDLRFIGDHTYFVLGTLGGCELLLVKCDAGSGGAGGSLATLTDAIRDVSPDSVIMIGIAFGAKPNKHKMCDVLVSKQVMAYELQRVSEDDEGNITITPRGDKASTPPRIHDRFWSGSRDWAEAGVHFGLIVSGDKLVDSKSFLDQLLQREPEAIGGEMEAAGVYAGALKGHRDWIIVKAIVDWGHHKEKDQQATAAKNAASLAFHVIAKGGIRR